MCGNQPPPEDTDPMHHRMKREGRKLRGDFKPPPRDGRIAFVPALLALAVIACTTESGGGATNDGGNKPGRIFHLFATPPLLLAALSMCTKEPGQRGDENRDGSGSGRDRRPPDPFPFGFSAFDTAGGQFLRHGDLAGWFRWVFIDLDHHEADCKWAATLRLLGLARTPVA